MKQSRRNSFDSHGTEGMLDVILGCTLIFLLLTALAKIDDHRVNEFTLPDIDLTRSAAAGEGATSTRRTVISLRQAEHGTAIWVDDQEVPAGELTQALQRLGAGTHVALRRDRDLPCSVEDQVILACRSAGIERVAITVQHEEP